MRDLEFDRPVHILLGGAGRIRPVSSAHDAADILLHQWPAAAKAKHRAARQALVDLVEGKATPAAARQAFEKAATEAKILAATDWGRAAVGKQVKQRDAMRDLMDFLKGRKR